ncbi:dNTP triphosphohydrolase [Oscillospiraceae bacterium MB08-C2-2]|nr:dNTP triphosphohydrolase [Oscillospiraceae bacterium MB08-C2-2]
MNFEFLNKKLFAAPTELAQRSSDKDNVAQKYRTMFMRDRDRVLYSRAFRRLSGKTQIYLSGSDDHQRTRLTHTLEVSQIAATISQALGLDRDLTEAIALGHDIGHTPFGHAGEQVLHEIMVPNKSQLVNDTPYNDEDAECVGFLGFKHNFQSVRISVALENIYGDYGLDLTNYTLWGLQRHSSYEYKKNRISVKHLKPDAYEQYQKCYAIKGYEGKVAWSFEAFVVAEADEIAQLHHDLEDAIRGNAMSRKEVCKTVKDNIFSIMDSNDRELFLRMKNAIMDDESFVVSLSRVVVNTLVNRIIEKSLMNLLKIQEKYQLNKDNINDFFIAHSPTEPEISKAISYDSYGEESKIFTLLRKYSQTIGTKVHNSLVVQRMNTKGQYIIRKLFQAYYTNPQQLPNHSIIQYLIDVDKYKSKESAIRAITSNGEGAVRTKFESFRKSPAFKDKISKLKLMRVICDHIAGMTDSYAIDEFKRLYN